MISSLSSYEELERHFTLIRSILPRRDIFKLIQENPLDNTKIPRMIKEGWRIQLHDSTSIDPKRKIISLEESLKEYERDKTLCISLVSAYYANPEEAIAEYLGRTLRKNPVFLKEAVLRFGLKPYIYDRPSNAAFGMRVEKSDQTDLFLREKESPKYAHVMMD